MSQQTTRAAAHAWWVTGRPELNDLCPLQLILGQGKLAVGAEEPTKYQAEMLSEPWNKRYARLLDSQCMPDDEMSPAADNDARRALTVRVEKTTSGPNLYIGETLVRYWVGCAFDGEAEALADAIRSALAAPSLPAGDGLTDEQRAALLYAIQYFKQSCLHSERHTADLLRAILAAPRQPGEMGAGVQDDESPFCESCGSAECPRHGCITEPVAIPRAMTERVLRAMAGWREVEANDELRGEAQMLERIYSAIVREFKAPRPPIGSTWDDEFEREWQRIGVGGDPVKHHCERFYMAAISRKDFLESLERSFPAASAQQDEREADNGSLEQLLVVLGLAGVQVNGGTHGAPWTVKAAQQVQADAGAVPAGLLDALRFYANGSHFTMHDSSAWDTVSGEPPNFYEDESNTATVEDGSVAKLALQGKFFTDQEYTEPPVEGEVFGARPSPAAESDKRDAPESVPYMPANTQEAKEYVMREDFERWAKPRGYSLERTTDSYKSQGTKSAWRGWRAAMSREQSGGDRG